MELWARFRYLELGWPGFAVLVASFFAALFIRRALPEGRRNRGRVSTLLLGAAPLVHLLATGLRLLGAEGAAAALHLVNVTFVVLAVTGLAGMIVFDIALGRTTVPTIVRDFTQTVAVGCIFVIILRSGGVDPLSALTTSAVAAAVVGLALQGIIANVFAGIVLQLDRTLKIGDVVQWGPAQRIGTIAQISWRSSEIHTREGDTAVVPNATLLTNEVLNLSRPTRRHLVNVMIPFHRRHAPGDIRPMLIAAAAGVEGVVKDPPPVCGIADFDHGHNPHVVWILLFWIEDMLQEGRMTGMVRERVWYAAERAGMEGPCAAAGASAGGSGGAPTRALRNVALLAPLDDAALTELAAASARRRFAEGERILEQGAAGDSLFVVEHGEVRVVAAGVEVARLGPGAFFGEMSLLAGEPRSATCEAARETLCWEIPKRAIAPLLERRPELLGELAALLAARKTEMAGAVAAKEENPAAAMEQARARMLTRLRAYFHFG